MTNGCSCGCSTMTVVTNARDECHCACACCEKEPKDPKQEIIELITLRESIEKRLKKLEDAS